MSMLVSKHCCFCVDLRVASFIIGYSMLILRAIAMVLVSMKISQENSVIIHGVQSMAFESVAFEDVAFHRLCSIIGLMIMIFEVLLTIALLVGLHKRLDQHLQMYYVGSLFFLVMGLIMHAVQLLRYAKLLSTGLWLLAAVEICMTLVSVYFLTVIRSYYYKMKEEAKANELLEGSKQPTNYFARTKPVLISNKP